MTSLKSHRNFTALAAAMLLGAAIIIPAAAQTAAPAAPAPSAPAPAAQSPAPARPDPVEARITQLHARLHITAAQEGQWTQVAQVMRSNAQQIRTLIEQRRNAAHPTAVEDLKAYEQIADAHAEGLKNLVTAFSSLYDTMSDAQKKVADTLFASAGRPRAARRAPASTTAAPSHS